MFEGTQDDARGALLGRLTLASRADPAGLPGVSAARAAGATAQGWTTYEVELAPGTDPGALLEHCTTAGFPLRAFSEHTPRLHEVFIHFVGAEQETPR